MKAQRAELARQIELPMEQLRPQIVAQIRAGKRVAAAGAAGREPALLRMRREMLARSLDETSREFDKVAKEVTDLGQANADLEARKAEIEPA